jgi:hypothetical protein
MPRWAAWAIQLCTAYVRSTHSGNPFHIIRLVHMVVGEAYLPIRGQGGHFDRVLLGWVTA